MIGILSNNFDENFVKNAPSLDAGGRCVLFTSSIVPPNVVPSFCVLQTLRAYNFDGTLISTDIPTTEIAIKIKPPKRKIFYVSSMEWMSLPPVDYTLINRVYQNENVDLLAKDERIFKTLSTLFKEPVGIMNEWNLSEVESI